MNYTKEELRIDKGNSFNTEVYLAKNNFHIASFSTGISCFSGATPEEAEGNLNLFLGSRDMYEALKALMFQFAVAIENPYSKDKEIYNRFSMFCKENGISMSKQINLFIK